MGIGKHENNFLKYSAKKKYFNKTITIGRQQIFDSKSYNRYNNIPQYCEIIFQRFFQATDVDSIDNSDYEGATIIHNLNLPIPQHLVGVYDTVYDGGALEHIYNVSQAIENVSKMLRPGGVVIHCVPANNQCGHGFYQFSPELFFSAYSVANGFVNCEIYLAKVTNIKNWYKVTAPSDIVRNTIRSSSEIQMLIRAEKKENKLSLDVQQSDYLYQWKIYNTRFDLSQNKSTLRVIIKKYKLIYMIIYPVYRFYYWNILAWVSRLNPMLKKINISDLGI